MRIASVVVGFGLAACGGVTTSSSDEPGGAGGANSRGGSSSAAAGKSSSPGVGPIDPRNQATELPLTCELSSQMLSLKLPCHVGANLNGGSGAGRHAVECELAQAPGQAAVTFIVPLQEVPKLLQRPVRVPFDLPAGPPGTGFTLGNETFVGELVATLVFEQVDPEGRAFVARLKEGRVAWNGSLGSSFACGVVSGSIWAVAGDFI